MLKGYARSSLLRQNELVTQIIYPTITPASTTEIAVAGGLLLLCLLLVASALPMTTLAWKGKM
jgi:hypothetical protein